MARLERENNRLKAGMGDGDSAAQIAVLQAKLDDATALNATYEEKLRTLTSRLSRPYVIVFVPHNSRMMTVGMYSANEEGESALQKELNDLQESLQQKDSTIKDLRDRLATADEARPSIQRSHDHFMLTSFHY